MCGPAWEKMNGAGWIKFGTEIPTSTGDKWTADGVFHRAGIVVEKGDGNVSFSISFLFSLCCCLLTLMSFSLFCFVVCFVDLIDKKFWFSGEPTKPEKYGYRKGSKEEARSGKLKQTMNRVVSNVAEGSLTGTVSKGWKNEFKHATEAAKGSAGKAEFLEKQLHLEKAAREKQQQDMEEMKRVVEELKKGNAAAPPSPSQSQSQVCFALLFFNFSTLFTQLTSFSSFFFLSCL